MKRQRVSSSALVSVGYDASERVLEVEFVSGEVYHYFDVGAAEVMAFYAAPSKGTYVNEEIKPHHRYEHVDTV